MEVDAYWKLYADNYLHVRHHETQRSTVATAIVAIAGALIAVISYGGQFTWSDIPLAVLIIVLGLFGRDFSAKQWERATRHKVQALAYRNAVDQKLGLRLKAIERKTDQDHHLTFQRFEPGLLTRMVAWYDGKPAFIPDGSVNRFWRFLYSFVTITGLVLLMLAFFLDLPKHITPLESSSAVITLEQVHRLR